MNQNNLEHNEVSLEEINADLMHQLDAEAQRADYLLGLLASIRELVGQIAIGVYQLKNKAAAEANQHDVIRSIGKLMPYLTLEQRNSVKSAIEFHNAAIKMNKMHPHHKPAWRDDHPLHEIEQLNFIHVVNSYY